VECHLVENILYSVTLQITTFIMEQEKLSHLYNIQLEEKANTNRIKFLTPVICLRIF